jgi:predicted ArsR family transcriptional regulator
MELTFTTAPARLRLARIKEVLQHECLTAAQLAAEVHISKRWVLPYITHLHDAGEIYIKDWAVLGMGQPAAQYALGNLPDKPRPKPKTAKQRGRAYRKRIRADVERHHAQLVQRKAKRLAESAPRPDPAAFWVPVRLNAT